MSGLPTPWYWRGLASALLVPASLVFRAGQNRRHRRRRSEGHELPLLVIGNPRVGGSGKTPISFDVVERLRRRGLEACWIGRGVGGDAVLRQVSDHSRVAEVGDEGRLARRVLGRQCYTGVPRSAAIAMAKRHGCEAAVSDDGMQSPDLKPDGLVVVLRAEDPWGNGRILPAGPLREGPECLARADLIVWHGQDLGERPLPAVADERWVSAWYRVESDLKPGLKVGVVTAIADPERLVRTVEALGCQVVTRRTAPDHRQLPWAKLDEAVHWVTTSKDDARRDVDLEPGVKVSQIGLKVEWADGGRAVDALIERVITGCPSDRSVGTPRPESEP
jgi:tetraacyldisaccharide 4'-kinase